MASNRRERGHPTRSLRGAERRDNLFKFMGLLRRFAPRNDTSGLLRSDRNDTHETSHVASRHAPLAASLLLAITLNYCVGIKFGGAFLRPLCRALTAIRIFQAISPSRQWTVGLCGQAPLLEAPFA